MLELIAAALGLLFGILAIAVKLTIARFTGAADPPSCGVATRREPG